MRIRCRVKTSLVTYKLSVEETCMLREVEDRLKDNPGLNQGNWLFSLNGSDPLEEKDRTLADVGIVPGDLLWIIFTSNNSTRSDPKLESLEKRDANTTSILPSENKSRVLHIEPATRPFQRAVPTRFDELFSALYTLNGPHSMFEAVIVLMHCLLVSAGFKHAEQGKCLPVERPSAGVHKLEYLYCCEEEMIQCHVACISMGRICVFHATVANSNTVQMCSITPGNHINPLASLKQSPTKVFLTRSLQVKLKDSVVLPLLNNARMILGFTEVNTFTSLPLELKFMILSHLDAVSLVRLSCTSKELHHLTMDGYLWHSLFKKKFSDVGTALQSPWSCNWKELYIREFIKHKVSLQPRPPSLTSSLYTPWVPPTATPSSGEWGLLWGPAPTQDHPLAYFFGLQHRTVRH